jgi:glutaredoxin
MDYLDQRQIAYDKIDVRADAGKMKELQEISGQTKTPTMVWSGSVLANFGVDELKPFLEERQSESGRGL